MRLSHLLAGALALTGSLGASAPAMAQAYQCRLPQRVTVPPIRPDGAERRVPITGYTLALSWSPEFCRARGQDAAHAAQCSGRNGRFGLIVHGLWPEGARAWPQWCRAAQPPRGEDLRANLCISPSARLLAHEWAKHGSCMARRPATYFKVSRILYNGLRLPDLDRLSREPGLTAGTLRTRFVEANPGWRAEAIGIKLGRRGWVEEVQLCYDRRFLPTRCDRRRHGARDAARVQIWRGI